MVIVAVKALAEQQSVTEHRCMYHPILAIIRLDDLDSMVLSDCWSFLTTCYEKTATASSIPVGAVDGI